MSYIPSIFLTYLLDLLKKLNRFSPVFELRIKLAYFVENVMWVCILYGTQYHWSFVAFLSYDYYMHRQICFPKYLSRLNKKYKL